MKTTCKIKYSYSFCGFEICCKLRDCGFMGGLIHIHSYLSNLSNLTHTKLVTIIELLTFIRQGLSAGEGRNTVLHYTILDLVLADLTLEFVKKRCIRCSTVGCKKSKENIQIIMLLEAAEFLKWDVQCEDILWFTIRKRVCFHNKLCFLWYYHHTFRNTYSKWRIVHALYWLLVHHMTDKQRYTSILIHNFSPSLKLTF